MKGKDKSTFTSAKSISKATASLQNICRKLDELTHFSLLSAEISSYIELYI